jgi:hypothetical protein
LATWPSVIDSSLSLLEGCALSHVLFLSLSFLTSARHVCCLWACAGFRVQGSGFRVQGSGFRVQGSGFRVQGSGFRVQGSGFRVQGSRFTEGYTEGCTV